MATVTQNKWCFVPMCINTSKNSPDLVFISVPKDKKKRERWFKRARRDMNLSPSSVIFCCGDHFNLEEDMENYMYHQLMGGRIRLKEDVVPHIFKCQESRRSTTSTSSPRPLAAKMKRKRDLREAFEASYEVDDNEEAASVVHHTDNLQAELEEMTEADPGEPSKYDKGIQARPGTFRSKGVGCSLKISQANVATSPVKFITTQNAMTSPVRKFVYPSIEEPSEESENEDFGSDYDPSSCDEELFSDHEEKSRNFDLTDRLLMKNPKKYLGLPNDWIPIIPLLVQKTGCSEKYVKLTLMKIKLNDSFERLADQFGISISYSCRMFHVSLPYLVHFLKTLIFWPEVGDIKRNLPLPFRWKYHNVQSIIDCFEVEIEKPSDPIKQALTWSEYKKCNTLKYLVSSTPDGFINFISKGYGGRMTDKSIVEESGFLDCLRPNSSVMADRGFKHIDLALIEKGCKLVRPPSVSSSVKPTKEEVLESKCIASLRVHIERIIRRIREFEFLKPHSVIHHSLIGCTDDVVVIAAALINLQSPIIK